MSGIGFKKIIGVIIFAAIASVASLAEIGIGEGLLVSEEVQQKHEISLKCGLSKGDRLTYKLSQHVTEWDENEMNNKGSWDEAEARENGTTVVKYEMLVKDVGAFGILRIEMMWDSIELEGRDEKEKTHVKIDRYGTDIIGGVLDGGFPVRKVQDWKRIMKNPIPIQIDKMWNYYPGKKEEDSQELCDLFYGNYQFMRPNTYVERGRSWNEEAKLNKYNFMWGDDKQNIRIEYIVKGILNRNGRHICLIDFRGDAKWEELGGKCSHSKSGYIDIDLSKGYVTTIHCEDKGSKKGEYSSTRSRMISDLQLL